MPQSHKNEPSAYNIFAMKPISIEKVYHSEPVEKKKVKNSFSVLTWNCNKKSEDSQWRTEFRHLQKSLEPEITLLQEIDFHQSYEKYVSQLSLFSGFFPNLELQEKVLCGVATLSLMEPTRLLGILSQKSEPFLKTKKPFLLTEYTLESGEQLTVINLHGINFVPAAFYKKQMKQILSEINKCSGPLIVAGDFNAWSHKRQKIIHELFASASQFDFKEVSFFEHTEHVKKAPAAIQALFGEHHLDRIFYSSAFLQLDEDSVMAHHKIHEEKIISSDHLPLSCKFTLVENNI